MSTPGEGAGAASGTSRLRQIGRHGLVYAAGIVLGKAVSFAMLPVYTRYLTPEGYGVLQLIEMTLDVIAILVGTHLGAGIFRFYHKTDDPAERRRVVSTALVVVTAAYVAAGALAFLAAPQLSQLVFGSPAHAELLRIAAASLALQSLVFIPLAFVQLQHRSGLFVAVGTAKLIIQLSLNIALVVYAGMGVRGVLVSSLVANAVVGLAMGVYLVRSVGFGFSGPVARALLRFGVPFIGTQLASFIITFGDRYFLEASGGTAAVGVYALAYQFGFLLVSLAYTPFTSVWQPLSFEVARSADRDETYARTFVYMNLVFLSAATLMALFAGSVIRVMSSPAFHGAGALVPLIALAYVFYAWHGFQNVGMLVRERTELLAAANWAAAVVALAGYALLIPRLGGLGAALATVVAYAARAGMTYVISQRLWPVRYQWRPVLRMLAIAVAVGAVGALLPSAPLWLSLSQRLLLFAAYLAAVWLFGGLPERDRESIRRSIRSPTAMLATLTGRV